MSYAAIGIGHREVERTSRYVGVRSVTSIWRSAARGGDVYRSRATKTADRIMRLAGAQHWGLTDGAGDMSSQPLASVTVKAKGPAATLVCAPSPVYGGSAARGGDVYRSRAAKTAIGSCVSLALSPAWAG